MSIRRERGFVLLTGATGFVGHRVLAELLARGRRCAVTVRGPVARSLARLAGLLRDTHPDLADLLARERIVLVECDIRSGVPGIPGVRIDGVIHAAASTRFDAGADGDPAATNVGGTRRVLEWCSAAGVGDVHLVSTAYVCGRGRREADERFEPTPPTFHNDYEASKWEAERLARAWAAEGRRTVTTHRPSVVVGEFATGRATKFDAFYVAARAAELLERARSQSTSERHEPMRVRGREGDRQNIVPVDYVASMIGRLACDDAARGRIYHLTHPSPPTNREIRRAMESFFAIGSTRFVEPESFDGLKLNKYERLFAAASRPVAPYLVDAPTFARSNAEAAEATSGIRCPSWDEAALHRIFASLRRAEWGRPPSTPPGDVLDCGGYFRRFLPEFVPRSRVALMASLDAVVRFIIEDEPREEWVCRFEAGRLAEVSRGTNHLAEEFGYRSGRAAFWKAVSGRTHPQELFLSGQAEIFGNVEKALKMAMVLNAFACEFPCEPDTLTRGDAEEGRACTTR